LKVDARLLRIDPAPTPPPLPLPPPLVAVAVVLLRRKGKWLNFLFLDVGDMASISKTMSSVESSLFTVNESNPLLDVLLVVIVGAVETGRAWTGMVGIVVNFVKVTVA
jgi:hypothetical protein